MKTNMLKIAALIVGAAFFGAAQDSHAQINAFLSATPNAVFGTSRVPADTTFVLPGNTAATTLVPSVIYKADKKGVAMRLDVVGMPQHAIYGPINIGAGHILGSWPAVALPADTTAVPLASRRPATVKGPDWRFAIYGSVAAANNAIAAWANNGRGATVLEPTAAQDKVLQFVDTRVIEWIDPATNPVAPAAGSLVGFNYTSAKDLFFTTAYLTGKVIVIYGPKRVNTAVKNANTTAGVLGQNIGYATRDAYWVTPALK